MLAGRNTAASTASGRQDELGEERRRSLSGSKGYTVEAPIGQLGTVDAIRYSKQPGRPELLVVRAGGADPGKVVLVPVSSIRDVVPSERRIVLRPGLLLRR